MTLPDYNMNIGFKSPYTQNAWGDAYQTFTPTNFGGYSSGNSSAWGNATSSIFPNNNYDWFNSYGWNFQPSTKSSTNKTSDVGESREEYLAKREEMLKKNEAKIVECETQINEANKSISEAEPVVTRINQNKKADGSSEVGKKLSEMSFWEKVGSAVSGVVTGLVDTVAGAVKGILGFDKDGNWSLKRCLLGVGTTVALILACTPAAAVAVPALAYLAPALAAAGVAAGVGMAAVGGVKVYKAYKHDSAEEFKDGFAKIGAGVVTAVTAGKGYKKCGGFQTAHENYVAIKNIKAGINPILAEFGTNTSSALTINTPKTGSGWSNYKNCVGQYKDYLNFKKFMPMAKAHQDNFNNTIKTMESKVQTIEECMKNTSDPSKLGGLTAQRDAILGEIKNLETARNGNIESWKTVGASLDKIKPKGWRKYIPFSGEKSLNKDIDALNKSLDILQKEKFDLVKLMSKRSSLYNGAVERFGFTGKHSGLWNYVTTARYSYRDMSTGQKLGKLGRLGFAYLGWEYTAAPLLKNNPCCYPMIAYTGVAQTKKHGFGSIIEGFMPGAQTTQAYTANQVTEINKQIAEAKKLRDDLIKKKNELSYC